MTTERANATEKYSEGNTGWAFYAFPSMVTQRAYRKSPHITLTHNLTPMLPMPLQLSCPRTASDNDNDALAPLLRDSMIRTDVSASAASATAFALPAQASPLRHLNRQLYPQGRPQPHQAIRQSQRLQHLIAVIDEALSISLDCAFPSEEVDPVVTAPEE